MFALNIQWSLNGVCDSMLKSLVLELVDTNNENGRHIYEWNQINQSNKQYSKLISIVHNGMTQIAWHFEGLEYLNTINIQYSEVSFAVTEWGQRKLPPLELIMDCRFGRSNHSNIQYQFNTSIHKWNVMKLHESFPIVPIWMDCYCGRFFNSSSNPVKSQKLHSPNWMDSYDSQFNKWNDFDSSSLASFFLYKLGIFFIIAKPTHIDWNSFRWI